MSKKILLHALLIEAKIKHEINSSSSNNEQNFF